MRISARHCVVGLVSFGLGVSSLGVSGIEASAAASAAPAAVAASSATYRIDIAGVQRVAERRRPFQGTGRVLLVDPRVPRNDAGIVMYFRGGRLYDHPVVQASYALARLSTYRLTKDQRYLAVSTAHAQHLLSTAVRSRGALYFPYPFDFPLHGKEEYTLSAPWYSAMAQGEVLSLFIQLHEITGDEKWKKAADDTFASFLQQRAAGVPWTVTTDDGLLWFEEYAHDRHPDRAFNGHVFALYGVYDYWWSTGDARARSLLLGGLTSALVRSSDIRVPGQTSRYCLSHVVQDAGYHAIHLQQLGKMYEFTGDRRFAYAQDRLVADAPGDVKTGTGVLTAGRHTGVVRSKQGKVTASRTVRLTSTQRFTVGQRSWVAGRPGVWLRVDSGALRGTWVPETAGSYAVGTREALSWVPARRLLFPAGRYAGYGLDDNGRWVVRQTIVLSRTSSASTSGRFARDGRTYVRVSTGSLRGLSVSMRGTLVR